MPGPIVPRRLRRAQDVEVKVRGTRVAALSVAAVLVAAVSNCGFPSYDFDVTGAAGSSASSGSGDAAGASGSAGTAANSGNDAGSAGLAGEAAAAGAAGAGGICTYPKQTVYPDHCFDNAASDGETGLNCGGGECPPCETNQPCVQDSDCLSGSCTTAANTCSQVLTLQYMSIVADAFTNAPKFRIVISYLDAITSTKLSDLRIRYYFNHNGVTEPVIALDTQATFDPGGAQMDISNTLDAVVHRLPLGAADRKSHKTDSYLEIRLNTPFSIASGGKLDITADFIAGSSEVKFDQSSHYSFLNVGSLTPTEAITVYRGEQRLWGLPPPLAPVPDCAFVTGVNLGGGVLTVGDQTLAAASDQLSFTGTQYSSTTPKPLPTPADTGLSTLLSTAFTFTSADTATWSVPAGQYWVYAWLTSAGSADSGQLSIQDAPIDKFYGLQKGTGSAWSELGPYPVDVTDDGMLRLSATGKVNVAGLELFQRLDP